MYVYDPNHKESYENVFNTIERYNNWMNSNYPAVSKANVKFLDTSNNQSTELDPAVSDFATLAGGIAGGPVGAVVGNVAGGLFNQYLNAGLQEQQFENQKELQQRAAHLNQQAQIQQASNQVIGLQQAGLNPALANGQGAPSVQAGAAAGATSQISNVFAGLAEIIQAIKAPTELEKMAAETNKTKAETGLTEAQTSKIGSEIGNIESQTALNEQQYNIMNPALKDQIVATTDKYLAETKGINNINDAWEAQNNYLKSTVKNQMNSTIEDYKKNGTWDKLDPSIKNFMESVANGKEIGIGEYDAMQKQLMNLNNLTEGEKAAAYKNFEIARLHAQMNDPEVWKAIRKLPADERNKLYAEIRKFDAEVANLNQLVKTGRQQEAYIKAQKLWTEYNTESTQNSDVMWLYDHNQDWKAERATWKEALYGIKDMFTGTAKSTLQGFGAGVGAGGIKNISPGGYSGPTTHGGTRIPSF